MSRKINLVASEDEEYNLIVEEAIETSGVYMIAVSDIAPSETSDPAGEHVPADGSILYDKIQDAFVYTVGHHEKNRPELIVFCGPAPGEPPVRGEVLQERIEAGASLLRLMVENWEANPVLVGQIAEDYQERIYTIFEEDDPAFKDNLMFQCIRYYKHDDFDVLVIYPNPQYSNTIH